MRALVGLHAALILVGALACALALVESRVGRPGGAFVFHPYVALAGFAFVLTRRAVVHARDEEGHVAARETALRRCAVGIAAWALVCFWFATLRAPLPGFLLAVLGFIAMALFPPFALPLLLLFAVEFGIVAVRKAPSPGAKWLVALVHFTAPLGYVALLLTA